MWCFFVFACSCKCICNVGACFLACDGVCARVYFQLSVSIIVAVVVVGAWFCRIGIVILFFLAVIAACCSIRIRFFCWPGLIVDFKLLFCVVFGL